MSTSLQKNKLLFEGYLMGNLSKTEESSLADWINSSEKNYQEFKRYVAENQFNQVHSEETILAWKKMATKISNHTSHKTNKKIIVSNWLKVAALVAFALLSGFFANQYIQNNHYKSLLNEIIVPNGEKAQVILSDGTKVYLNAGTHLKYPSVFSKKKREVSITGEAFFEVTKDKSNPFMIETQGFDVRVTGTSFNLKTYQEDEENSLTLHTGEVTIANEGREYKIRPGEKYIFNTQTKKSNIVMADLGKSFLWKEGAIVIDDLNLEQIRKVLERKFNVQIKITDEKYKKIRYNGQFKSHESLMEILDLIRETSPVKFKYEINETKDVITIK